MAVWSKTSVIEITDNRRIDSEFFHPEYITTENLINQFEHLETLGKLGKFKIGPFGSAFHVSNYEPNSKYRYVRGKDVKPFSLQDDDNVYMPEKDYNRLIRYALQKDDLLISVVGTLGNVAIVPEGVEGIFSCKSTVFRESKVDPYYLLAYFNSKYGRLCLLRRQRGAIQMGLNKEDLKTVPVPLIDEELQTSIGEKIKRSLHLANHSKSLYTQATQMLEDALGLNNIEFKKEKSYTAYASEVASTRRMNAEYFSPTVKAILAQYFLKDSPTLGIIFQIIRGTTPREYLNSGVPVLKTKNVRVPEIDKERIVDFVTSTKDLTEIRNEDLLLASMGVGSLGRMSYISNLEQSYVVDGTIRVLRPKPNTPKNFQIPTLLFLSSNVGQELIYRGIVGSTGIISLPDDYLKKIPIPIFSPELCDQLTQMVSASIEAKRESKRLLEQAKKEVETLIEQAAQTA
jgi:type I restriction enzyme S subunit